MLIKEMTCALHVGRSLYSKHLGVGSRQSSESSEGQPGLHNEMSKNRLELM